MHTYLFFILINNIKIQSCCVRISTCTRLQDARQLKDLFNNTDLGYTLGLALNSVRKITACLRHVTRPISIVLLYL